MPDTRHYYTQPLQLVTASVDQICDQPITRQGYYVLCVTVVNLSACMITIITCLIAYDCIS